jgi:hypothetical protein
MANDSGMNTSEVQEALAAPGISEEDKRYLERVLEFRGVRQSVVSSHEIVEGNPEAYSPSAVEQQKDLADGRPHEPVKAEDTNIRGNEAPATEAVPAKAKGNQNADKK